MSKIIEKIKEYSKVFDETLFPGFSCDVCSTEIKNLKLRLCQNCIDGIVFHNGKLCAKCGMPVKEEEVVCEVCKDRNYNFNRAYSVCDYGPISAALVKSFKFDLKKYIGETIASMMAAYFNSLNLKADYLTFVPLGEERLKERGFNQTEVIANELSKLIKIPVIDLLTREVETPKQSSLDQKERLKNLKDAFKVKAKESLKGKTVMLIDDVFTTGATLDECSKALKKLKPEKIIAFTFAKTNFKAGGMVYDY